MSNASPALIAWWTRGREQWRADPPARQWRDVMAYLDLDHDDERAFERRIKEGLADADPGVRDLARLLAEDAAIARIPRDVHPAVRDLAAPLSEHLRLELAAAHWRGGRSGRPVPLEPGAPVPGCGCEPCTGVAARPDTRTSATERRTDDYTDPLPVDAARAVPILDVAAMLGLTVNRSGYALCPFHDDTRPSFHVNARKAAAFCNPCGKSWDVIALVMDVRGLDFAPAVRWMLNLSEPERRKAS